MEVERFEFSVIMLNHMKAHNIIVKNTPSISFLAKNNITTKYYGPTY